MLSGRIWIQGQRLVDLQILERRISESIQYNERIQTDWLKCERLPIALEFQAETVDLSCRDI